jgi:hypothetical protein
MWSPRLTVLPCAVDALVDRRQAVLLATERGWL